MRKLMRCITLVVSTMFLFHFNVPAQQSVNGQFSVEGFAKKM